MTEREKEKERNENRTRIFCNGLRDTHVTHTGTCQNGKHFIPRIFCLRYSNVRSCIVLLLRYFSLQLVLEYKNK